MKKFYTFLVCVITAAVAAFSASASTVTFVIDNYEVIDFIEYQYLPPNYDRTAVKIVDEVSAATQISYEGYKSFYIVAKSGYAIQSIKLDDTEQMYSFPQEEYSMYVSDSNDGNVYIVKTVNLDAARTASATFTVDVASKVNLEREGKSISLTDGTQTVKFNPETETRFLVRAAKSSEPIYSLTVNGAKQTDNYGSYSLTLANGDSVEIVTKFPEVDYTVKVEVPEGMTDLLQDVTWYDEANYTNVTMEGDFLAGVPVRAGKTININFNYSKYNITGMYVNGNSTNPSSSYRALITGDLTLKVEATPFSTFTVPVTVDNAQRLSAYKGYSNYDPQVTLTDGTNYVEYTESAYGSYNLTLIPTQGNKIVSVMKYNAANGAEGTEVGGGTLYLAKGDSIVVTTDVKTLNGRMLVWFSEEALANVENVQFNAGSEWGSYTTVATITPKAGAQEIKYCTDDAPFFFRINLSNYNWELYTAMGSDEPSQNYSRVYSYYTAKPLDIFRVFGNTQPKGNVAFTIADGVAATDFNVTLDGVTAVDDLTATATPYIGSQVVINKTTDADIAVTVDGKAIATNAGVATFTVTGEHKVEIAKGGTNTIDSIADDHNGNNAIYNLQGVRVTTADQLPAGIYIINGKKVAVK